MTTGKDAADSFLDKLSRERRMLGRATRDEIAVLVGVREALRGATASLTEEDRGILLLSRLEIGALLSLIGERLSKLEESS